MKEYSKRFKSQIPVRALFTEIPEDWSLIALTLGLLSNRTNAPAIQLEVPEPRQEHRARSKATE